MALGEPNGWEGNPQQAQEPQITSTLAAGASLASLQVHAEPSVQAPLSSANPVESPLTLGRQEGARLPPCPPLLCVTLSAIPSKEYWSRGRGKSGAWESSAHKLGARSDTKYRLRRLAKFALLLRPPSGLTPNTRADLLRDPCSHILHHPVQKKTQTQGHACVWGQPTQVDINSRFSCYKT